MKTGVAQERSEEVLRRRLAIDGRDQHAAALIFPAFHILLGQGGEKKTKVARRRRAVRLFNGQEDLQIRITSPLVRYQLSVAQDHTGAYATREHPRAILFFTRRP